MDNIPSKDVIHEIVREAVDEILGDVRSHF